MIKRLQSILEELEDIDHYIQNGCIDPMHLDCFEDEDADPGKLMAEANRLTGTAFSAIEELAGMMKEEK